MSWLFSRALVEEFSEANSWDGEQFVQLSVNPTPQAYLSPDKMTEFSRLSRFGMTFKPLTENLGTALLMWFLEDSRARTSVLPEKVQASQENARECGPTWRGSLAKFDPDSCSWKTVQLSLLGDSELSSVTWPRPGMTAAGQCWELPMSERRTSGTDFGCLLPTPVSIDAGSGRINKSIGSSRERPTLALMARKNLWPTPSCQGLNGGSNSRKAFEKCGVESEILTGGQLNPTWVEWLMGWPLGWTDLKPLAMDKSHYAPQKHGDI